MNPHWIDSPFSELPRLTHLGWGRVSGSHVANDHRHLGYEIVYFNEGVASVSVTGGEPFPVRDGDLLVTAPDITHHFKVASTGISYSWLGFQMGKVIRTSRRSTFPLAEMSRIRIEEIDAPSTMDSSFPSAISSVFSQFVTEPLLINCLEAEPVFKGMITELTDRRLYAATIVYCRLLELLTIITRHLQETRPALDLRAAMDAYIDAHLDENLSLRRLADHMGYNPCYLSRLYKAKTDTTISEAITRKRIGHAKRLMSMGRSITDAASQCGYADAHHFSTAFKRMTGMTPSQFRGVISPPQVLHQPAPTVPASALTRWP
jgi:AraC-like DNA-binding protein